MKQIVLVAGILLAFSSGGLSQGLTKKEKIRELFTIMHQDTLIVKTIDGMTTSMVNSMTKMLSDNIQGNADFDVQKFTQKIMERSMKRSKENALKLLNNDLVDIYDKYFTIEEVDQFTNFYKSKAGQKLLLQMPDITKDIMSVMSTKYQAEFQKTLTKDIEEVTEEMTGKKTE